MMGVVRPVLICAVLLGLLSQVPASSEEQAPLTLQDISILLDYLQNRETYGSESRPEGEQPLTYENIIKDEMENDPEQLLTQKRAGYMALCHFKICNMGRKRTYSDIFRKRKMWPRL
ncbi:uncharacterized protein LOC106662579 [Cimex lectularius]|uniref:Uncharacterized protein n=1 Tax=Cimex lectularius TaxID=79782 RepID=A0A8I6REF2_CIMLE|nr:uncharacterized protein LOC106662579 [Cimex lectularius]